MVLSAGASAQVIDFEKLHIHGPEMVRDLLDRRVGVPSGLEQPGGSVGENLH